MKIRDIVQERIDWNALRQAKAVMPYLLDSPELRAMGKRPNPAEPNIFTSTNLKQYPRQDAKTKAAGGDKITPLRSMSPEAWQEYMDTEWKTIKQNAARGDANAKGKLDQIKQAAADAKMPITEFIIMPHTADTMGLIHKPGVGPNNRFDFKNKGNNKANENTSDEAWELLGQKDPAIRKYVADLGLQNDQASVDRVVPMIDKARQSKINPSQIPQLKNLANKPADPQALKNILKIKGTPQAPEQFAKIMQARDQAEGRSRGYDVSKLINAISSGDYDPPVVLKLPSGNYVIGGRTRLYAALALNKPINVKVLEEAPPGREKQVKALKKKFGKSGAYALAWAQHNKHGKPKKEAAGVGIVTKQNATKDVPVGGQYMNVKKLKLDWKEFRENFADGKKKGKSRPGRVKRAGASCKGSVTALRKRAKNSSGEKAKMYHWCANMKSGRKK